MHQPKRKMNILKIAFMRSWKLLLPGAKRAILRFPLEILRLRYGSKIKTDLLLGTVDCMRKVMITD
jgi:hypothetical protein